jgi:hypothetical protein
VKNFAFASEQVVGNSETSHGFQVQADDGVGDDLRDFGFFAAVFFDGFQSSSPQFRRAGFVFFKKVRNFGVEIPAVVVEAVLHGRHFHADGTEPFHVEETNHDVGDLHAGVVDVVLDLDRMAGVAQDTGHGVAEDGVSYMPDVRGFIGIDAGVFDDHLSGYFCWGKWRVASGEWRDRIPKCGAVEVCVQVSRTGDLDSRNAINLAETIGNFLCNLPGGFFQALGQLEADGRRGFPHFDLGRAIENDIHGDTVVLLDVASEGLAQTIPEC